MTATEQCIKAKLHLGHYSLKDKRNPYIPPQMGVAWRKRCKVKHYTN